MAQVVRLSTCNLNQWALDFDGNLARIKRSIALARAAGSRFRTGPELEITGYGCEDHFLESDTMVHALECLAALLGEGYSDDLLVDIGLPLLHNGARYNVRALCLNREILLIRPKLSLADDGNYREGRWFTAWRESRGLEDYYLPAELRAVARGGQRTAPMGIAALRLLDATLAVETCEELFTPSAPHIRAALAGVDVLANGSGSHHQLRKLNTRVDLMREATEKCGGVYLYANQKGCDGGRLYFDGCAMVMANGACLAQGAQFGLLDVEVLTAAVDLEPGRSKRSAQSSLGVQASAAPPLPMLPVDYALGGAPGSSAAAPAPSSPPPGRMAPTPPRPVTYVTPEEEIGRGPAAWLWDYLRRSGAGGFFLPLSGGADSAATASIVGVMCHMVCEAVAAGGEGGAAVLADVRRITKTPDFELQAGPSHLASAIFHTAYMGTANSSTATRHRAAALASQVGSYHTSPNIDAMVGAVLWVCAAFVSGRRLPRFGNKGGSVTEDLALQNLQARLRMVLAYFMAQLLPWVRGKGGGFLLVLGSANVDESLRGYMTKYDCSSADLNPIGAISKADLASFLRHAAVRYSYPALAGILSAPPTAELRPSEAGAAGGGGGPAAHRPFGAAERWLEAEDFVLRGDFPPPPSPLELLGEGGGEQTGGLGEGEHEHSQLDEADMGMSYAELSWYGRLRKVSRCGPLSMYTRLLTAGGIWERLTPAEVAVKVKRFFFYHAVNRHKMCTLTPSYHAENYSPDDNRYDHRPFLYNTAWSRQYRAIDEDVAARAREAAAAAEAGAGAAEGGGGR